MTQLLFFLPESTWILVIVGLGFAVMFQIIRIKTAFSVIAMFAFILILGPVIGEILSFLPLWGILLVLAVFSISMFNLVINGVFGRRTSSHFWAILLHNQLMLPFRFLGFLFRRRL